MNNLPDVQTLAELKKTMSYHQLSEMFGVAPMTIWHRLERGGLLERTHEKRSRKPSKLNNLYWLRLYNCLALIRQGVVRRRDLQVRLGYNSISGVHFLINRLVAGGYAVYEPNKAATLRPTEKGMQTMPELRVVRISPDGVVESINGR